jgi:hypothetical protein
LDAIGKQIAFRDEFQPCPDLNRLADAAERDRGRSLRACELAGVQRPRHRRVVLQIDGSATFA